VQAIDSYQRLVERVEWGGCKINGLSKITVIVAFILDASYFSQLIIPYISGTRYVRVDLLDPGLVATQIVLMIMVSAWLYVGLSNYLFVKRLRRNVGEIRAAEKELEKRITG
jgi:hypothetical protein